MPRSKKSRHQKKSAPKIARKKAPKSKPEKFIATSYASVTKNRRTFNYQKAKDKLEKFGFKIKLGNAAGKKRAKNLYKEYAGYINHTEKPRSVLVSTRKAPVYEKEKHRFPSLKPKLYTFKFQKLTKHQRKLAENSGLFSRHQFTPTGVFIEKPANIPAKNFKVTFKKGGVYLKGGSRSDVITRLDSENFLENPAAEVKRAVAEVSRKGRTAKTYSLMVNGYRSRHSSQSLKSFSNYITNKLLPEWLEKNEGKDEADFADMFHLRIIY